MKKFIFLVVLFFVGCSPSSDWAGEPEAAYNLDYSGVNVWAFYTKEDMVDAQKVQLAGLASKLVQEAWYKLGRTGAENVDTCLDNVMFYTMEDELFYELTGYSEDYVGSAYYSFTVKINELRYFPVYIKESEYYNGLENLGWTLIHEYIHVALYCLRAYVSHDERYFWNYDEQEGKEQTVEYEAYKQLLYHLEYNSTFNGE